MEIKGNQLSDMKSNGSSPLEQKKYVNALGVTQGKIASKKVQLFVNFL